jgi:ComF family protein
MLNNLCQCLAALIPPRCVLCGGEGQWLGEPWGMDLCKHCEQACPRWVPEPLPFDAVLCPFRYAHPVDRMITQLKFHGELACARALGTLLARAHRTTGACLPRCIVPMPLHRARYRQRGFCQTTEIARHVGHRLRGPHGCRIEVRTNLLQRVRDTRAQSGLSATERAENLRGAFAVPPGVFIPDHVALLDDVLTTGHTALAATAALRDAGVGRIELWCCARAGRHDAGDYGV